MKTINIHVEKDWDLIVGDFIKKLGHDREQKILLDKLNILFPEPEMHYVPDPIDEILRTCRTRTNSKKVGKKS